MPPESRVALKRQIAVFAQTLREAEVAKGLPPSTTLTYLGRATSFVHTPRAADGGADGGASKRRTDGRQTSGRLTD